VILNIVGYAILRVSREYSNKALNI